MTKQGEKEGSELGNIRKTDLILRKINGAWHVFDQNTGANLEILERRYHSKTNPLSTMYIPTLYPEQDFDEEV